MHDHGCDPIDRTVLEHLKGWQGRSETLHACFEPVPARALAATLEREGFEALAGERLPPLWHWLYFLTLAPQSGLGPDGHPKRGGFLPPVPLPRRMWAGGRLRWQEGNPLRLGEQIERRSRIESVTHKKGRSGALVFVQVAHELHNGAGLALTETHDIVYRSEPPQGTGEPVQESAPQGRIDGADGDTAGGSAQPGWQRVITPDPVLLFRYSALTFNGHRIHYDRNYATEVEGYAGLVVHGPLIATLLLELLQSRLPGVTLREFTFRALRPLLDTRRFSLHGKPLEDGSVALWAADWQGRVAMQATASVD